MIPLCTPADGEIVNLAAVARLKQLPDGTCRVVYTDGQSTTYTGASAAIMVGELKFLLDQYRELQKLATGQGPKILTPDSIM